MADLIAHEFVACPVGGIDYGLIEAAHVVAALPAKILAGPIRLQHGYPGPDGFGYRHVDAYPQRVAQIQGLGFQTFPDYCWAVANRFERIGTGRDDRLILLWRYKGYDLTLVIEPIDGQFWTIVTGLPKRIERCQILCEVARTDGSEPTPDVAKRPRLATLSLPKKAIVGDNGP